MDISFIRFKNQSAETFSSSAVYTRFVLFRGGYRGNARGFQIPSKFFLTLWRVFQRVPGGEGGGHKQTLVKIRHFPFFSLGPEGSRGFQDPLTLRVPGPLCGAQRVPWEHGTLSNPPLALLLNYWILSDLSHTLEICNKFYLKIISHQGGNVPTTSPRGENWPETLGIFRGCQVAEGGGNLGGVSLSVLVMY